MTLNSISNNGKRSYVDVFKALKNHNIEEVEIKDIWLQNIQKYFESLAISK